MSGIRGPLHGLDNDTLTKLAAGDTTATANTANLFVSQSQIKADITALSGSDATAKNTATTTWTNYMNSDTGTATSNTVHLYTKWNGTDATADADKWVEFRIVQVGEHDGDGSNVTFMAVHSLPTAQAMNSTATNANGWEGSAMRTTMTSYVEAGLSSDFKSALKTVSKKTVNTSDPTKNKIVSETQDSIWLMSYRELTGRSVNYDTTYNFAGDEGSQYAWFSGKVAKPTDSNAAISNLYKTRAGSNPELLDNTTLAFLRSPYLTYDSYFVGVDSVGRPNCNCNAGYRGGVCIALSM